VELEEGDMEQEKEEVVVEECTMKVDLPEEEEIFRLLTKD